MIVFFSGFNVALVSGESDLMALDSVDTFFCEKGNCTYFHSSIIIAACLYSVVVEVFLIESPGLNKCDYYSECRQRLLAWLKCIIIQ